MARCGTESEARAGRTLVAQRSVTDASIQYMVGNARYDRISSAGNRATVSVRMKEYSFNVRVMAFERAWRRNKNSAH